MNVLLLITNIIGSMVSSSILLGHAIYARINGAFKVCYRGPLSRFEMAALRLLGLEVKQYNG